MRCSSLKLSMEKAFELPSSLTANWNRTFPTNGQGTVVFSIQRATPFCILVRPKKQPLLHPCYQEQWISLEIGEDVVCFKLHVDGTTEQVAEERGPTVAIECDGVVSYWLSYDIQMMVLKYGKGYCMVETTIMECDLLKGLSAEEQVKKRQKLYGLFGCNDAPRVIEQYDSMERKDLVQLYTEKLQAGMPFGCERQSLTNEHQSNTDKIESRKRCIAIAISLFNIDGKVYFFPEPLINNRSPLILDSSKVTLLDLDGDRYTLSSSLPATCKELYCNVAHGGVCLDSMSVDAERQTCKLTDAIRYSIENEDGILYKKLKEKARGESVNENYLRITLGGSLGNSPGIPYVLEIWPNGYGSPIHNHGNSYAVIKVLHGGLTISIYNKHVESCKEQAVLEFDVKKGDVTWISPNWYQTHRLWNHTNDYCATIQCYNYGHDDTVHCPSFHYVSGSGATGDFIPNSDFSFREMRTEVLKEYKSHLSLL